MRSRFFRDRNPVLLDRLQAQLFALASDPDTFAKDPDPADRERAGGVDFAEWPCDLDKRQGEISDLMMNNASVRKHYTQMVPEQVTHKAFWTRYFFKVHLIELQRRPRGRRSGRGRRWPGEREVIKGEAPTGTDMCSPRCREESDSGINWDDVEDLTSGGSSGDIPADLQNKLLSDYERELITQKVKKGQKEVLRDAMRCSSRSYNVSIHQGGKQTLDEEMAKMSLISDAAKPAEAARHRRHRLQREEQQELPWFVRER